MCWHLTAAKLATGAVETAKDAAPALGAAGAVTVGGGMTGMPPWLIALGQAVIVVVFTLRGLDRRLRSRDKERDEELAKLSGKVATLSGEVSEIPCLARRPGAQRPSLTPCPTNGNE